MKAFQVIENGKPLEERELDTPTPSGREVVLKTVACGVCHSDVHIHDGYFELGGGVQLPSPLPGGQPNSLPSPSCIINLPSVPSRLPSPIS